MIHILDESSGEALWMMRADLHEMLIIGPVVKQKMAAAGSTSVPLSIDSVGFPNSMGKGLHTISGGIGASIPARLILSGAVHSQLPT